MRRFGIIKILEILNAGFVKFEIKQILLCKNSHRFLLTTKGRIHNTSFSSQLTNRPNKLECLLLEIILA